MEKRDGLILNLEKRLAQTTAVEIMFTIRLTVFFFFSSRRRHTRSLCDWSSDVCSSDLGTGRNRGPEGERARARPGAAGRDGADRAHERIAGAAADPARRVPAQAVLPHAGRQAPARR